MVMQTSCKKDMEQMDLLQAFEIIVDKAKNSSLGEKFYEETDSYLGFVCKGESKRSDVPTSVWEKVQEHYSISSPIKDKNNGLWIHKDFIGNKNWNNSQAIKNLRNGKTLNNFSIMFDEAIDCVKGLDI